MRLWSLHPRYLDRQGLTATWREALLAQAVLAGRTRGYTAHPQLTRFRAAREPQAVVGDYLAGVAAEATSRGYRYDLAKIEARSAEAVVLEVTRGQLRHEWVHLALKLERRSPDWLRGLRGVTEPDPHPLFRVVDGPVEPWEVVTDATYGTDAASGTDATYGPDAAAGTEATSARTRRVGKQAGAATRRVTPRPGR